MPSGRLKNRILWLVLIAAAAGFGWVLFSYLQGRMGSGRAGEEMRPVPVDVAPIQHGPIELERTFNGSLEAAAEFVVAPKVSGRVERLFVHIADTVSRGQIVAELDNDEYVQAVAQARADLAVAKANLAKAESALDIANREFSRTQSLRKRGIASDSDFDAVTADRLAKQAQLEVAEAEVIKAESSLETARIRLGYTKVTASWTGGNEHRVVAERYIDEGQTVAANIPLLSIVELDPINGVVFVTERDYARLQAGQVVSMTTDAYPGEQFQGRVNRIAPIFRDSTRQARVEMTIENQGGRLKPGMFIRVTAVLGRVPDAVIVPEQALTTRDNQTGVFVVSEDNRSVTWRAVTPGIRQTNRVQVEGPGLSGRVVTMGQQFIGDGSAITIPADKSHAAGPDGKVAEQ